MPADGSGDTTPPAAERPLRRETFLARYSRNFKLACGGLIVVILLIPLFLGHRSAVAPTASQQVDTKKPVHKTRAEKDQNPLRNAEAEEQKTSGAAIPIAADNSVALNQQDDHTIKLVPAPDPALSDDKPQGALPRISEDGRQPWQVYARPFNMADKRPRVSIVVMNLGLARAITDDAIARLPAEVTLAFSAQSPVIGGWVTRARQDGHEVLMSIPMEPFDYPRSDPGPNALLTSLPNSDNIERFLGDLRLATGYIGVTTISGSRFITEPTKMQPILDIIKQRGLMIFDAGIAPHSVIIDLAKYGHLPAAEKSVRIDDDLVPEDIQRALDQLEKEARLNGRAVGVVLGTPLVFDELRAWIKDLPARGIALAPLQLWYNKVNILDQFEPHTNINE